MAADCPTASTLRRLLDGTLDEQAEAAVTEHLDECRRCRRRLERFAAPETMAAQIVQRLAQATPARQPASPPAAWGWFVELSWCQKVTAVALLLLTSLVAWTAWRRPERAVPNLSGEKTKTRSVVGDSNGAVVSGDAPGQVRPGPSPSHAAVWCIRDKSGDRRFGSLEEALAACPQDGLIEVEASGTVPVAPLRIAGRRVTIRAADGFRPTLAAVGWDPDDGSPWWLIDHSRITVEQLGFAAPHTPRTQAGDTNRQPSVGSGGALWYVRDAFVEVRHCRLEHAGGGLFRLDAARGLMCADSECLAGTGTVFECVGAVAANVSIDHCVLAGASIVRVPVDSGGVRLRVKNSAVLGAALAAFVDVLHSVAAEPMTQNSPAGTIDLSTRDCWFVLTQSWFTGRNPQDFQGDRTRSADSEGIRTRPSVPTDVSTRTGGVGRTVVVWADTRSVASFAIPWFDRGSPPESVLPGRLGVERPPGWRLPEIRVLGAAEDLREQAVAVWRASGGRGWYDVLSALGGSSWPVPLNSSAVGPRRDEGFR